MMFGFTTRILHTVYGYKVKQYCFLETPFLEKKKKKGEKWHFCFSKGPVKDKRIFYLKINRIHQTSFDCIQHWLDIIARMNGYIYFVCDNPEMKKQLFKKPCFFYDNNFSFIKSDRKTLRKTLKKILSGCERFALWFRIASAMMTPFTHAAHNKFSSFYNIDADDIMLLVKAEKIAQALLEAEKYANKNNLDCFNLDMFLSKSLGLHWSFGVVYTRNSNHILNIVKKNSCWKKNDYLISQYKTQYIETFNFNVDWFFTFLRDTCQLKIETFYIEKAFVIHMPDICISRHWSFCFQWKDGVIVLPILKNVYEDNIWGTLPIYNKCVKIDIGLCSDDLTQYMNEFYSTDYSFELKILDYAHKRELISNSFYQKMYDETNKKLRG